jgi:hypothetical protein
MIARLVRDFAALFVVTAPRGSYERAGGQAPAANNLTYAVLALIVVAGTMVRFWGLGDVGLHGDEKTMALPVLSLLHQGLPLMPSGMFYPRAVGQLYMMAGSVMVFGQSEWALRLPSALCGVLLILLTWQVGKRFLAPWWNLALTAAVAFLPAFIEDAQTARMYVFLVTFVAAFMALVFAWERSGRLGYLIAGVFTLLVGIQFHTLAIFAAFLVFIPALLSGDERKFWTAVAAFAAVVVGFEVVNHLIGMAYPKEVGSAGASAAAAADGSDPSGNGPHATIVPRIKHIWMILGVIPALALSVWVFGRRSLLAAVALSGALIAEAAFQWHAAVLLTGVALVLARRDGELSLTRVVSFFILSVAIGAGELIFLLHQHAGSMLQIAGVLLGWPSVWPFLAISGYSAVAMLAVAGGFAAGLWQLAHRRPVPDYVLLIVLGVWIPLLIIGWIKWNIPARYAAAQIMPILITAFASLQSGFAAVSRRWARQGESQPMVWVGAVATVAFLVVVNPVQVAKSIDSGYADHPDHKGAAEFVTNLHPGPHDIIIAEDVLQQTYYLGHVNYWLYNKKMAAPFMHKVKGRWLDFYTDTPLIGSGSELEELVERSDRGAIYVIGSGEDVGHGRELMTAQGISEALNSPPFKSVYLGRDGLTRVWKVDAPPSVAQGQ